MFAKLFASLAQMLFLAVILRNIFMVNWILIAVFKYSISDIFELTIILFLVGIISSSIGRIIKDDLNQESNNRLSMEDWENQENEFLASEFSLRSRIGRNRSRTDDLNWHVFCLYK